MTVEEYQAIAHRRNELWPVAINDIPTACGSQASSGKYSFRLTGRGRELLLEEHASNYWRRTVVKDARIGGDFDAWVTDVDARKLLEGFDGLYIPESFKAEPTAFGAKVCVELHGGELLFTRYNLVFKTRPRPIPPQSCQDISALVTGATTLGSVGSHTLLQWAEWSTRHLPVGGQSRSSKLCMIDDAGTCWIVRPDMILAMAGMPHLRNVAFDKAQLDALAGFLRSSNRQIRIASSGDQTRNNWLTVFSEEDGTSAFVAAPAVIKAPETLVSFHALSSRATHEFILDVGLLQQTLPGLCIGLSKNNPQVTMEASGEVTEPGARMARRALVSFSAAGDETIAKGSIIIVLRRSSTSVSFRVHPNSLLHAARAIEAVRLHAYYVQGESDLLLQSPGGAEASGKGCLLVVSTTESSPEGKHA